MNRLLDQYIRNDSERDKAYMTDKLAAVFATRASKHDLEGSFPFENFNDLRAAGYLSLTVPQAYGGQEISLYELALLQERLAYGDGSTALAVGWHLGQILHLRGNEKWPGEKFATFCESVVQHGTMINTFASEAATGSPSRGGRPKTTATNAEGGWLISGRKTFSTLSPILDLFVVTAYVPDEDCVAEFLVHRTERVHLIETWDTIGMRATGSHDVVLDKVFVPHNDRLPAKGKDDGGGWLLHIPACYMGIAIAARDYALKFSRTYTPRSIGATISTLPTVQQSIGEMEAKLRTARSLLYATADRWDQEVEHRPELKPDLGLAKYVVTNSAIQVVDLAMRIVGGTSLSRQSPLERYYRDVRAGLHNPPMENTVLQQLATDALSEDMQG